MTKIIIYTRANCLYCWRALDLLGYKMEHKNNIEIEEINIGNKLEKRKEMQEKSGRNTFPQIFINDTHIGGYDDLFELDRKGRLDEILGL